MSFAWRREFGGPWVSNNQWRSIAQSLLPLLHKLRQAGHAARLGRVIGQIHELVRIVLQVE
jgi:hypothetical protein